MGRLDQIENCANDTWWREHIGAAKTAHQRRWAAFMNRQRSEQRLVDRLNSMKCDDRQVVLAYGSWGARDCPSYIGICYKIVVSVAN